MYYLEKCAYEGCTRTGSVALKPYDTFCNIHKKAKKENGDTDDRERDENGHFVKQNKKD